jgi:hypothetical protein
MAEEAEKITPSMIHADGTLLDDPGLRKEFPIYALLSPFIAWGFEGKVSSTKGRHLPDALQTLAREDGVTPYSSGYWEEWYEAKGNMDPWLPINETLAEVANVLHAKPGAEGIRRHAHEVQRGHAPDGGRGGEDHAQHDPCGRHAT